MDDANVFNAKGKLQEVEALLERFIPSVERMQTQLDQYKVAFTDTTVENASLKKEVLELQSKLDTAKRGSVQKKLDDAQLLSDYRELRRIVKRIPPEILERAKRQERSAAAMRTVSGWPGKRKSSTTRLIRSMLLTPLRVASGRISWLSLKAKKDKRSLKHGNVSRTRSTWNRKIS